MKSTNKRLVSILLCLAMVLAVLPMAVFAADTVTLYCDAPDTWTNCNVYWWGGTTSTTWPGEAMAQGSDGIWYYDVPSDATNVIFNNGSAQSADLTMPTDDNVQWNYEAKSWGTYGSVAEPVETVYYLRGSMNSWDTSAPMTKQDDGTYTITMDLTAGTYEFKAGTEDWGWSCPSGQNASLTLDADDSVTFTLDLTANTLTTTLGSGSVVAIDYYIVGDMNNWTQGEDGKMTDNGDGTYSVTMTIAAGTYGYKANNTAGVWYPDGENMSLVVDTDCDVTFVLNTADGTITATGDGVGEAEDPEPVVYDYYVAGSEGLCGVAWDPASNQMTQNAEGLYEITFSNIAAGSYEFKITTGTWDPSYGPAEGGNYMITVDALSNVTITFNAETTEVATSIEAVVIPGAADIKWQLNADATADAEYVSLRLISWVDSLDYATVTFNVTINGETAAIPCTTVYTAINADGSVIDDASALFGDTAQYFVTYTITELPAAHFDSEISVSVSWEALDGTVATSDVRTIVVSDGL